jgi:hypothetical protein
MPRSTTAALRDAGPAAPRERAALLLGGAAVVMAGLMLLLARGSSPIQLSDWTCP